MLLIPDGACHVPDPGPVMLSMISEPYVETAQERPPVTTHAGRTVVVDVVVDVVDVDVVVGQAGHPVEFIATALGTGPAP